MKRRRLIALFLSVTILCTGCGTSGVDLTEEENDMVAEYIAGLLLKYDYNYDEKLLYDTGDSDTGSTEYESDTVESSSNLTDTNQNKTDATQAGMTTDATQNEASNYSTVNATQEKTYQTVSQIYSNEGCKVSFSKVKECQSYPAKSKNSYFLLEANKNKKLLVLTFNIKNGSSDKKEFCLINSGISYQLEDGEGKTSKPLLTALTDDLQYLDIELEAGETDKAVILFEVPQDADKDTYTLYVTNGDMTAQIPLS